MPWHKGPDHLKPLFTQSQSSLDKNSQLQELCQLLPKQTKESLCDFRTKLDFTSLNELARGFCSPTHSTQSEKNYWKLSSDSGATGQRGSSSPSAILPTWNGPRGVICLLEGCIIHTGLWWYLGTQAIGELGWRNQAPTYFKKVMSSSALSGDDETFVTNWWTALTSQKYHLKGCPSAIGWAAPTSLG